MMWLLLLLFPRPSSKTNPNVVVVVVVVVKIVVVVRIVPFHNPSNSPIVGVVGDVVGFVVVDVRPRRIE